MKLGTFEDWAARNPWLIATLVGLGTLAILVIPLMIAGKGLPLLAFLGPVGLFLGIGLGGSYGKRQRSRD